MTVLGGLGDSLINCFRCNGQTNGRNGRNGQSCIKDVRRRRCLQLTFLPNEEKKQNKNKNEEISDKREKESKKKEKKKTNKRDENTQTHTR